MTAQAEPDTDECKHLILRSTCAYCRPRRRYDWQSLYLTSDMANPEAADGGMPEFGPRVIAQGYSTCQGCGEDVRPGQEIQFSEAEGAFVCNDCASSA